MIDPHVHLRDWKEKHKETVSHGLQVAIRAGLDGVFEMPNTDPLMVSRQAIEDRMLFADSLHLPIFHGLYAGVTSNPKQIEEIVQVYHERFPRVVGFKMYAGKSVGNLAILSEDEQRIVFQTLRSLGYEGVLAVHCEKESLLKPSLWKESEPFSHTLARPPEAEVESVRDMIRIAAEEDFRGVLHICHVSTTETVEVIQQGKERNSFRITCGSTPHHLLLDDSLMKREGGFILKVNPPLKSNETQKRLRKLLKEGKIDWIETDHAPHTYEEKRTASGLPGFPAYPHLIARLKKWGLSQSLIDRLTHENIVSTFGIEIPNSRKTGDLNLQGEYDFDPYNLVNSDEL